MPGPDADNLKADQDLLLDAVGKAATLAHDLFKRGVKSWAKSDDTPVTEADLAVNDLLHNQLTAPRSDYGWLSEETQDHPARLGCRRVWVIDPIDGTRGFVRGNDQWCISAALVEDGKPLIGVIHNPVRGEVFRAIRGSGAFLNDAPITATRRSKVPGCRLVMHESIVHSKRWNLPWPEIDLTMRNSMALRLCQVAAGQADGAVVISGKCDWDLAAADVLVSEAGGEVTGLTGSRIRYNGSETVHKGIVAAGTQLHEQLLCHTRGWQPNR